MKVYAVRFVRVVESTVLVEAENEEEAKQAADELGDDEVFMDDGLFSVRESGVVGVAEPKGWDAVLSNGEWTAMELKK